MKCSRCRHENRPGAKFCEECAAPLDLACANCGAPLSSTAKFCPECAHPTGKPAAAPESFDAPARYTPQHLAEKILLSKSALEGERKQVTVLFADLKGSMELLADRDPEEARKILDPVLERMMEAVHHYEGTVNQVMGDGIMALFGAPLAHEDHAVRACYAALRMQETVRRYAEEARRAHGVTVRIRVGLNSGDVVVRAIGSDLHMDYTAVGQTTHLAARMEQLADPGSILASASTLALAEGYVQVRSLGPIPVKGLADPVEVYELTGAGQARTRLQAAALRGLTRFVGRDAEVEHLRRVLTQADAGRGQVVAIVGEAGVGKSRLTYEFTHSHRVQDWLIVEASSVSYGKATSYLPVIDLLKGYFKIGERDDHREMRAKVLGRVLALDRALEPLLPPLLALLDVPVDDAAWTTLDPPQRRQRTLDAVKRLLLREAQVQPLLVVFEDLHWVDGETQTLLDNLVESLGSARLLLLVNYRPEYEHRWGSKTTYSQLRLDSLPAESTQELLVALLGLDHGLAPLTQMLVKRGNPFFLEETVRTLVETGALAGERGAYRLTRPVESLQVPSTVQTILAARIDRLPPEEKQLLQAASAIGKDFPHSLLAAIADQPDETLRRALAHLQEAEFVYETQLFPDLEYTFKHALTHEVTYGSLLNDRRKTLHAQVVVAIERLYPDRLNEQVERLAHHALRGEVWDKALSYFRQAGEKAAIRSANREAIADFEQALSALAHLPERKENIEAAIDLRFRVRTCLIQLGDFAPVLQRLREAEALARAIGDERRLGWVHGFLCQYYCVAATPEDAVEEGRVALDIAESLDDFALCVVTRSFLGIAYRRLGANEDAKTILLMNVDVLAGDLELEHFGAAGPVAAWSRSNLVGCLAEMGQFAEGISHGEEALRIARDANHSYALAGVHFNLGYLYLCQGELQIAIAYLERGMDVASGRDVQLMSMNLRATLGYAYAHCDRLPEGEALLSRAVTETGDRGMTYFRAMFLRWLAELHLRSHRVEDARREATCVLDLTRMQKEEGNQAWALRLLGEIDARAADTAPEAERHYRESLSLAERRNMRPLVAHCHFGLGKLYAALGKTKEARREVSSAVDLYQEMGMTFYLDQARASSDYREGL